MNRRSLAPARNRFRWRLAHRACQLFTVSAIAATIGCWSNPAHAQLDEWRQGMKAAYRAQYDAGKALDDTRGCVAEERGKADKLGRSYRIEMDDREADLQRDRIWREKLREDEAALALYDRSPNVSPAGREALKWLRGETLRKGTPPKSTPYPILEAREALRGLQGQFEQARRIRVELDQARAKLADCERRLPALEEAFQNALERYDAHMQAIVPEDNSDIERLTRLAEESAAASRACGQMECPTVDCADSTGRLQGLLDAETHLADMVDRLALARADAHKHHKALADQLRENTDRHESVDAVLGAQEFLVAAGSFLLDVTSIVDGIQNIDFFKEDANILRKINQAFELAKDGESRIMSAINVFHTGEDLSGPLSRLESRIGEKIGYDGVPIGPEIFGNSPVPAELSTLSSHLADLVAISADARDYYKKGPGPAETAWSTWNTTERAVGLRINLGQLVGRIAKDYAQASIAETKDRLRELARSIEAETAVMIPAADQTH